MFYEFRYLPVAKAFSAARKAGADVAIRYEAQACQDDNEAMISNARIRGICRPQKSRAGIRHNKFLVLIHRDEPVAVWTGSTNISAGGVFGHSNVGHVIWDKSVALKFLDYWERLADPEVTRRPLVQANLKCAGRVRRPLRQPIASADLTVTMMWIRLVIKTNIPEGRYENDSNDP